MATKGERRPGASPGGHLPTGWTCILENNSQAGVEESLGRVGAFL
jgi:hypothetical protein